MNNKYLKLFLSTDDEGISYFQQNKEGGDDPEGVSNIPECISIERDRELKKKLAKIFEIF